MKRLWNCRRTFIAFVSVVVLAGLGFYKELDVTFSLVSVVGLVGACNVAENVLSNKRITLEKQ